MNLAAYLPRWTKRVALGTGGRDPLGLSRVTHHLTNDLVSGIITTTEQARYYSVYCWILWHIEQTETLASEGEFYAAYRRREAAFAVITMLDPERRPKFTPIGIDRVEDELEKSEPELSLDFGVIGHHYGGFGQIYGGSLYNLGLWERPTSLADVVTEGTAMELACAVDTAVAQTPYGQKRLWQAEQVSREDLVASAEAMSLDALRRPGRERERDLIIDLLFGLDDSPDTEQRRRRRLTLASILWVVRRYEQLGLRCRTGRDLLEWVLLYAPVYHGVINEDSGPLTPVTLPEALRDNVEHWRLFCAQQYLTMAHEGALAALLAMASASDEGLSIADALDLLINDEFHAFIAERVEGERSGPRDLLAALGLTEPPPSHDAHAINEARPTSHPLSENALCWEAEGPEQRLAQSLLMLAALYARWRVMPSDDACASLRRSNVADEPWVETSLAWLDDWFDEGATWTSVATALLKQIVARHEEVVTKKSDLRRCWLNYVDGRICHVRDLWPTTRSSRHWMVVSILRDLGVLQRNEPDEDDESNIGQTLSLTELGARTLARIEEQW